METYISSQKQTWLPWFARGILILGFLILVGRLVELQVIKGAYYKDLADSNRIRRVVISAPRGRIIARGGELLVGNIELRKKVVFDEKEGYLKTDATANEDTEDHVIVEWVRDYPLGEKSGHISGYVGIVNETELGMVDPACVDKGPFQNDDIVGRSGLEKEYNCILRGKNGEELIEVDTSGKLVRILGIKEPEPGRDIVTTIDYSLQSKVAESLSRKSGVLTGDLADPAGKNGSFVISDSKGEILALYSYPSFDPNMFSKKGNSDTVESYLRDNRLPLFNRAISGQYHPGSVFKPIVAAAALTEDVIDSDFKYTDTGKIDIKTIYGDFSYTNWFYNQYGRTEGEIDLVKAISRSTDTFFYKVGEILGIDKLVTWSKEKFRLDKKTGIDLPGEIEGLVPSPEWKEMVKGERWFLGNTYHMSIGQGDLALTPLGLHNAIVTIANQGEYCKPHIFSFGESENLSFTGKFGTSGDCQSIGISKNNINKVKEGMYAACTQGGTGYSFFDFKEKFGVDVACKTGTAETSDGSLPHAWFVAFMPVDTPELVATVMVENGGEGSKVAGPIMRDVFSWWQEHKK